MFKSCYPLKRCFNNECVLLQDLLDKILIPMIKDDPKDKQKLESLVFYLKMKGDYYRYLAEVSSGQERKGSAVSYLLPETTSGLKYDLLLCL